MYTEKETPRRQLLCIAAYDEGINAIYKHLRESSQTEPGLQAAHASTSGVPTRRPNGVIRVVENESIQDDDNTFRDDRYVQSHESAVYPEQHLTYS